ncbi:MAG: hypothetical protein OXI39_11950 [Gemmatimonadota bacterium]|uniref:hypothetical protein n=1 Tax=Candidatus Palauibacter scopulicola TaxID=3056741 RepID=UPI00238E0D9E|nr:hypothetical protein [Candidatus Palauibacter scopulicola]MDE2663702.1 hypothetical protein [Candidatus Palauibacter scopulicola]
MSSEATVVKTEVKKNVNRSPRHPSINLEDAIDRTTMIYRSAWDGPVGIAAACEIIGLSYSGSTGKRTVSALLQFGLLESTGRGAERTVKLTERALNVVTDEDGITDERNRAIRECALMPTSYRTAWDRWGPRLPTDDRVMAPTLIRDGFNPNSTADFLRDFRATVEFAALDKSVAVSPLSEDKTGDNADDRVPGSMEGLAEDVRDLSQQSEAHTPPRSSRSSFRELTIPLRGGEMAILSVPIPMTRHNYNKLSSWLAWAEDTLVVEEELEEE